ncbi:MAG: succinate dehydrogenase cytochrome b subunit [Planctomycetaceae bacterium]
MSWLTAALRSSVGKKFVMGITGLFLCVFLLIHLAGNLVMLAGEQAYNDYAHALHANPPLLITAEVFLYLGFLAHIYLAIATARENWAAREQRYAMSQSKQDATVRVGTLTPSTTMFATGTVIFGYLILHLSDFKFGLTGAAQEGLEPFDKAKAILSDGLRVIAYVIGALFVGVHVSHGLASACQSLGFNHPKYNHCIRWVSRIFAIAIAAGFIGITLWLFGGAKPLPGSRSSAAPPASATSPVSAAPLH